MPLHYDSKDFRLQVVRKSIYSEKWLLYLRWKILDSLHSVPHPRTSYFDIDGYLQNSSSCDYELHINGHIIQSSKIISSIPVFSSLLQIYVMGKNVEISTNQGYVS